MYHAREFLKTQGLSCSSTKMLSSGDVVSCDAFVLGNFIPDIYVGYIVKPTTKLYKYAYTHFADPCAIPVPRYDEFWERYVELCLKKGERPSDCILGCWAHLVADAVYNTRTRAWLIEHNIKTGEDARIRKQHDFSLFGARICPHLSFSYNEETKRQLESFSQYEIEACDYEQTVEAANQIVADSIARAFTFHDTESLNSEYKMFDSDWFEQTTSQVNDILFERLKDFFK